MSTFVGHKQQFILETMVNKAIITVVGKDTVGIIAQVCTYLAENKSEYSGYFADHRAGVFHNDDDCGYDQAGKTF